MPMTLPVDSPQTARVVDTDRLYEHNLAGKRNMRLIFVHTY